MVKKTESPSPTQDPTGEDGEDFRSLTMKLDEYQDLMATCESLAPIEENKKMEESCSVRLKALRQELLDLSNRLQVKPD